MRSGRRHPLRDRSARSAATPRHSAHSQASSSYDPATPAPLGGNQIMATDHASLGAGDEQIAVGPLDLRTAGRIGEVHLPNRAGDPWQRGEGPGVIDVPTDEAVAAGHVETRADA